MKKYILFALLCLMCHVMFAQIDMDNPYLRTQTIAEDLSVQGSLCVGMDCASFPAFALTTIRLRENNLRIEFDDTSDSGTFASNDWTLEANSSINAGTNHFAILDVTGGKVPFKLIAGAPTNALFVDAEGDVGIGTNVPGHKLHVVGDIGLTRLIIGASDLRLKKEIESIQNARSIISALDGKKYHFRNSEFTSLNLPPGNQFGLIAQDVEKVLSDVVYDNFISYKSENGQSTGMKGINYNAIIPVLINAVKEQDQIIIEQDQIIAKQAEQIKAMMMQQEEILCRLLKLEK